MVGIISLGKVYSRQKYRLLLFSFNNVIKCEYNRKSEQKYVNIDIIIIRNIEYVSYFSFGLNFKYSINYWNKLRMFNLANFVFGNIINEMYSSSIGDYFSFYFKDVSGIYFEL